MLTKSYNSLFADLALPLRGEYIRKLKAAEVSIQPIDYVSGNKINIGNLSMWFLLRLLLCFKN